MFAQRPGKLEEEFSRPVESIMRCEDFKSNFARRLSNRFISRSPVSSPKQDSSLKLLLEKSNAETVSENVPERIESCPQLSKLSNIEQIGEAVKPPDKVTTQKNSDIRNTEVTALNMEVETLRWQLTQTENNRQMHIALLKQVVTFLNRVREHIECQSNETVSKKGTLLGRSFNAADLPRSRSVLHVNKNVEYTLSTPKKFSSRKISKSISNVNGFKDSSGVWNQSKLSLTPETENSQKISEEMSRLITLANTVLSTKIPDLASTCNDNEMIITIPAKHVEKNELPKLNESTATINSIKEDIKTTFIINTIGDSKDTYNGITNKFVEAKNNNINHFIIASSKLTGNLEDEFSGIKLQEKDQQHPLFNKNGSDSSIGKLRKASFDKNNDYNSSNFIEDESGFSSMNSFQEIGIPIISIIPPSPCKEMGYMEDIPDNLEESEKWKTDTMELEKQTMKVFWV